MTKNAIAQARRATILEWFWWANLPIVCGGYAIVSKEPLVERVILIYLAAVSIIALAATYGAQAKAAEAKAAAESTEDVSN